MPDSSIAPSIISAISGLAGTIIGGCITYWLQRSQRQTDRAEERRALALGIAAEIDAYVELVEARNHSAAIRGFVALLRSGQNLPLSNLQRAEGKVRDYFPLFYTQLEKIGFLGEHAADLAKFYTRLAGVFATVESASAGRFDGYTIPNKITLLENELDLWENALRGGRAVAIQLKNMST